MAKQRQHKTARRKTPMGSKYNNAVVLKMEDKHKQTKKTHAILFKNSTSSNDCIGCIFKPFRGYTFMTATKK